MYIKIKGYYSTLINYFPEYQENPEYVPPKRFMWAYSVQKTQLW